jgi:hypothetical protein
VGLGAFHEHDLDGPQQCVGLVLASAALHGKHPQLELGADRRNGHLHRRDLLSFFRRRQWSIYRASMPIGNFPGTFTAQTTVMTDNQRNDREETMTIDPCHFSS